MFIFYSLFQRVRQAEQFGFLASYSVQEPINVPPLQRKQLLREGLQPERTLKTSLVVTAAMSALVLAMAGMTFLVTPRESMGVSPSMLNSLALASAFSQIQLRCQRLSLSLSQPFLSSYHCFSSTYWMQCSGVLGLLAMVQQLTLGLLTRPSSREHSQQLVLQGSTSKDCPSKPSVAPSRQQQAVSISSSLIRNTILLRYCLASILSSPPTMMGN